MHDYPGAQSKSSGCGRTVAESTLRGLLFIACFFTTPAPATLLVALGQNFTASTYGTDSVFLPPDCNGAAGPTHYVELINGQFAVFDKVAGTRVQTMTDEAFWKAAGLTFGNGVGVSDPRLVYDPTVQRWFASAIDIDSSQANNRFLLAVSSGIDPTGSWSGVAFAADPAQGNFADFPTLGLDGDGVYLSALMFAGNNLAGVTLVSIPKTDLTGETPTADNRSWFGTLDPAGYGFVLQPAVSFDPPTGAGAVLAVGDLGLDLKPHSTLVGLTVQGANATTGAFLTSPLNINVPSYSVPLNPTQPNGQQNLDDGDARFSAMVYQVSGILYAVHSTQLGNHTAIRWYKINAADFTLLQSGTISDPSLDLFYPSIAANPSGVVVICYNACSASSFVSIYAQFGETSADGLTTFGNPQLLKAGSASYTLIPHGDTTSRWGDYSSVCVDPVDSNRFWTINMFPSSATAWATQVTELLTATGIPELTITGNGGTVNVCWPSIALPVTLESTASLTTPNWVPVTQNISSLGGQTCATVPATGGAQFFRLRF